VLLPEFRNLDAGRLDLVSAALSLASVLALVYGIKELAQSGFGRGPALSMLVGVAIGLAFQRRQRALAEPLVDLQLLRRPAFAAALAANTLSLFLIFGSFFLIAQYLQLVLGLSPLAAGLWTVPSSLGFIVGSLLAPAVVRRLSPGVTMAYALAIATVGLAILAGLPGRGGSGLAPLVAGSILLALGISPVVTLATDLIVASAPPERAGVASGLSETGTELGGALGIAVLGSIVTAVYRGQLAALVPTNIRPHALAATRSTLAGAVQASDRLPPHVGAPLLAGARDAFTSGMHVAAIVGAALALTLAVTAATILRRERPAPEKTPESPASTNADLRVKPC